MENSNMPNQDRFFLFSSIAIEAIVVGVQRVMSPSWGLIFIMGGGGVYLFHALFRFWRARKHLSPVEVQHPPAPEAKLSLTLT